jgi:hypothetical protein
MREGKEGVPTYLCVPCDLQVGGDVYEFIRILGTTLTFRKDHRLRAFKNHVLAKLLHLTAKWVKKITK